MTSATIEPATRHTQLWQWIRSELAPFPGRTLAVMRFVLISAIVILISMTLQVPFLALSLIMVFFTAQENTVLTRLSGVMLMVGTTLAIALSILLLKFTYDHPMLRILGAGFIAFCGMYFMRISRLGVIGFMVALLVMNAQSLVDVIDGPEALTRALLWVWVASTYPIVITITINYLMLPAKPGQLLKNEMLRQLNAVEDQLEARRLLVPAALLHLDAIERGVLVLHRHLAFATMGDKTYRQNKALHLMRITTVDRLHTAAIQLSRLPSNEMSGIQRDLLVRVQGAVRDLKHAIISGTPFAFTPISLPDRLVDGHLDIALREMGHALDALEEAESSGMPAIDEAKEGWIAMDAFSNPIYARFALKAILATLTCYTFYTGVQWPGIHTSMLTCLIMALPSLGASSHKGILRIVGCALGSIVTLIATVFVMPHLDSIVGLLMLTLPMIAIGAWVATGSARTGYIGVQFSFAYALALLGQFGPTSNITEIRDRMIGILVGAFVSIMVFSLIWPEREGEELQKMLARLLRSIAGLAKAGQSGQVVEEKTRSIDKARLQSWSLLAKNREIQARVALEPDWQNAHNSVTVEMQTWFSQVQETLFAVNWLQTLRSHTDKPLPVDVIQTFEEFRTHVAFRLEQLADTFDGKAELQADTLPAALAAFEHQCTLHAGAEINTHHANETLAAAHTVQECIFQLGKHLPQPQPVRYA